MSTNKITHLANPTDNTDGTNKKYIDDNYLKLSGGNMTGNIEVPYTPYKVGFNTALSAQMGHHYFVQINNPYCYKKNEYGQ